jgi:hypothetical protein
MAQIINALVKDVKSQPEPAPENTINYSIADNPAFNRGLLRDKIIHNIEMSDQEFQNLMENSYEDILKCIFDQHDVRFLEFVSTPRFITTLTNIMLGVRDIPTITRIYINNLVYDYLTYHDPDQDQRMTNLMVNLGRVTNQRVIYALTGLGVPDTLASYIALASKSSSNNNVNIRRVNFIIATALCKLFDFDNDDEYKVVYKAEQMVIDIYSKLFPKIVELFESTMFDVYNLDEYWVTEDVSIMYSMCTNAVLDIVNAMPTANIRSILLQYHGDYCSGVFGINPPTRASLHSLSNDYSRINDVIELLKNEGVYIF